LNCTSPKACVSNPCLNGATCNNLFDPSQFTCTCVPVYSGPICATLFDNCASSPCVNGGNCSNGINSFECTCPAALGGTTCAEVISGSTTGQSSGLSSAQLAGLVAAVVIGAVIVLLAFGIWRCSRKLKGGTTEMTTLVSSPSSTDPGANVGAIAVTLPRTEAEPGP